MNIPADDTSFAMLAPVRDEMGSNASRHLAVRPEQSILMQYWRIVLRRKWVIIGAILITVVLGAAFTLTLTRKYTAVSVIQIAREDTKVLNIQGVRSEVTNADQEFYQTQLGLLKTRSLAERVVRSANLLNDPVFRSTYTLDSRDAGEEGAAAPTSLAQASGQLIAAREILLKGISIIPVRNSGLFQIAFTSPNPELAAKIANAWATGFIQANIDRGFDESKFARGYLEERLRATRARLEQSERAAVDYATRTGIFKLNNGSPDGKTTSSQSIQEQQLAAYSEELNKAVADRISAESLYRSNAGSVENSAAQGALATLRQRRAELAAEYQKVLVQFEPEYPAARALQQQIAQLDRSIASELSFNRSATGSDLRARYNAAVEREKALREKVAQATQQLLNERRTGIQFNINDRDVDTNRQLYEALLQRYKEVGVAGGVNRTNVSVADMAEVPTSPSSPKLLLNLLLAAFLGSLIGIALTIAQEQVDDVISDPDTVDNQLGMPLLGTIPDVHREYETPVDALRDPKSSLTESYLSLRTVLSFTTSHGVPKTLSFTSTRPAEGKSTSALALAATLANAGKRVLLIDCDMRLPSIHNLTGLSNPHGLSNALTGDDDLTGLIQRLDMFKFDVLTAGPIPPNAADLLSSPRFGTILNTLSANYDHVICDGPPVIGLADALVLASRVEGTIYAVESNETRVNNARVALQRLEAVNSNILGIVMTKYEPKRSANSYDYAYGYGKAGHGAATSRG
jgi:polysaccharide biosynthesis transport protein